MRESVFNSTLNSIIVATVYRSAGLENRRMEDLFWESISYWKGWYESSINDKRVYTGNGCWRLIVKFGALSFPQNSRTSDARTWFDNWEQIWKCLASDRRQKVWRMLLSLSSTKGKILFSNCPLHNPSQNFGFDLNQETLFVSFQAPWAFE